MSVVVLFWALLSLGIPEGEVILSETTAKEVVLQCPEHLAKAT